MTHRLTDLLTLAVLAFVATRLVGGLRRVRTDAGRALVRQVVRQVGWRHVWPVPLVLAAVVGAAWVVLLVPGLDWGWWTALGGNGNPVFGASETTAGTVWERVLPLVFVAMLLPALPLFALAEERLFRRGAEEWSARRRLGKVLQFGLVHTLIGIPVGVALCLSIGGMYFMGVYLRHWRQHHHRESATVESAAAHTVYNAMIIGLVVVAVLLDAFV